MSRIPEEVVQEVVAATDIVDLIGSYFPLKRAGSNFRALCPFHKEKTASFNVNPQRNIFHCFGCGRGGDAVRFVMDYENLTFPEAVRKLADRAGIVIREDAPDPEAEARGRLRSRLIELHRAVAAWYHQLLLRHPVAEPAREYLRSRGLTSETAKRWQLGFAPENARMLREWAASAGFRDRELIRAGLLSLRDESNPAQGVYARFRERLMFPVANDYGDVIAFSGRVLAPDAKTAKYMNSPETAIFDKSRVFYGLDRAKRAILREETAIVCEGQLDLIRCAEAGIENVVAPLGTAFTEHHARLLARHARKVILCFDADNAGRQAAERAFGQLARANTDVLVATMPAGEDPDSLIRGHGVEAMRDVLRNAAPFLDDFISRGIPSIDPASMRDRVAFAERSAAHIAAVDNQIAREAAIHQAATRLQVDPQQLRQMVVQQRRRQQAEESRSRRPGTEGATAAAPRPDFQAPPRPIAMLCRLALTDAESHAWLAHPEQREMLSRVPGSDLLLRVLSRPGLHPDQPGSGAALLTTLPPEEQSFLSRLLDERHPAEGIADTRIFVLQIERESVQHEIGALQAALDASPDSLPRLIKLKDRLAELTEALRRAGSDRRTTA